MSLRKLVSAILAFAFVSTSFVPAFAVTLDSGVTTLPVVAPDVGTAANGANRDVVPVNLRITAQGTEITYTTISGISSAGSEIAALTVSANGQLSTGTLLGVAQTSANGTVSAVRKALVVTPPSGTKFVKLISDGYATASTSINGNLAAAAAGTLVNLTGVQNPAAAYPASGVNGSAIIASLLTQAGPASTFGTAIPAGAIVVYFVTTDNASTTGAGGTMQLTLTGFGLAADPAASPTSSGTATATFQTLSGGSVLSAISGAEGGTVNIASYGSRAGKTEFLMLGDKTGAETSTTAEPDSQNNTVLGNLLTAAGTVVNIGPGNITTTASNSTSLKVDTDALILRAAERNDSAVTAFKFYETPFATSSFVTSTAVNENGTSAITTLNTALTDTSVFPNTANALISVKFNAYKPGTTTASSATMVVNAVSVTIFGPRAFNGIRGQSISVSPAKGGATQGITGVAGNGGWLGAVINPPQNGNTLVPEAKLAIAALYNGGSSSSRLTVKDAAVLNFTEQLDDHGFIGATQNVSALNSATAPTLIHNGSWTTGIFPGVLIAGYDNGVTASAYGIVAKATDNGTGFATFLNGSPAFAATTALEANRAIYSPSEVTVRLVNSSGATTNTNAWFFISGNEDAGNDTVSGSSEIGLTNSATDLYSNGATVKIAAGNQTTKNARNNVIAVARLAGDTLQILPITNKYDGFRDAIAIRPEITLTLDTTSKSEGVDIVAVATGGNLSGSTSETVAKVLAAGAVVTDVSVTTLPISGNLTGVMVESSTAAGTSRNSAAFSSITGATTSVDTISDLGPLTGTGLVLDTTVPPLFCGGTAGTGTKGPNGVVFQPKARAVVVSENGLDAFSDMINLGSNTVVRVTLPTGWDINAYNGSLASSQILGLMNTGGFGTSPSLVRVQPLSNGNTALANAFIDISLGSVSTPTVASLRRSVGLIFKPNALVAPTSVTDFTATISLVNTGGTSTRDGAVSDDVILDTLGTTELATGCSTFLTIGYCDDGLDSYQKSGSPNSSVVSERVANGANLTTFASTPGSSVRLIANSNVAVTLPDICVAEGVADALPIGATADGVSTQYGTVAGTTTKTLHIASSFNGSTATGSVGLEGASGTVYTSDNSITAGAVTTVGLNELTIGLTDAGNTVGPFEVATEFRIKGLTARAGSGTTPPPAQNLLAWFEASDGTAFYTVGSNTPQAFNYNATNGTGLSNVAIAVENGKLLAAYNNGNLVDGTRVATVSNFSSSATDNNTNTLSVVTTAGGTPTLSNAVTNIFDGDGYTKLDSDVGDTLSVSLSAITGSTEKLVELSAGAGTLEAGSVLSVSTTGSGPQDTMVVPVLGDGSFKALVRASTSQNITVIQTPDSPLTSVAPQVASLAVADANVDPILVSATVNDIGITNVTSKSKVAVVFTVEASGKLNSADFVPTAAQLTLGGQPVTAVTGSTTKFIALVNLNEANALTLTTTVGDGSSVTLTGLTTVAAVGAKPVITNVVENAAGFIFVKGTNLKNTGTFGFVLSDGTFTTVALRNRTKQDKEKARRRSADAATIPATAVYAVFFSAGGVSTIAVN